MSDASAPSNTNFLVTLVAAIGGFAIFVIILIVAYLPGKPEPLPEGALSPEARKTALADLRAKEKEALTTYGWVDQANGVVRLPVDRAVELTIQELNANR
ncbi:MAG: hypothetical protein ABII82_16075 [Verrucomicrobiota bacterium]